MVAQHDVHTRTFVLSWMHFTKVSFRGVARPDIHVLTTG